MRKFLSLLLSIVLFSHAAIAATAESQFWSDRRKNLTSSPPSSVAQNQYASLPSTLNPQTVSQTVLKNTAVTTPQLTSLKNWGGKKLSAPLQQALATIPLHDGIIHDIFDAGEKSQKPVLLIQDIHQHEEAQEHIAAILKNMAEEGNVSLIGIEGAFGKFDFSEAQTYSDAAKKEKIAKEYLSKNLIGAHQYAGLTSNSNFPAMIGLDDVDSYEKNVQAYLDSQTNLKTLSQKLNAITKTLSQLKKKSLSPSLLKFDALRSAYANQSLSLGNYAEQLNSYPAEKPFAFEQFLEASRMENRLNFDQVEKERQIVFDKLTKEMTEEELKNLLHQSMAYRAGKINFGVYYQGIKILCQQKGISLRSTPAFDEYIRYVLLADGMKANQLFAAIEEIENKIIQNLASNDLERSLMYQSEQSTLIKKISQFSLTPDEWIRYQTLAASNRPEFSSLLTSFEEFYRQADLRSNKMTNKLLLERKSIIDNRPSILITGGFHTPEIFQKLKDHNISTIVVSPKVTKVDASNGSAYLSVFAREKNSLEKILTGEKLFIHPTRSAAPISAFPAAPVGQIINRELTIANKTTNRIRTDLGLSENNQQPKSARKLIQPATHKRFASWGVNPDSFVGRSILAPILEFHWTPVLTWGMNPIFIAVFPIWGSLMAVLFAGLLFALSHGTPGKNQSWSDFRGRLLASWTIHLLAFAPMLLDPSLISSLSSVPLLNSWLDFSLAHPYISQAISALGLHGLWNAGPWENMRLIIKSDHIQWERKINSLLLGKPTTNQVFQLHGANGVMKIQGKEYPAIPSHVFTKQNELFELGFQSPVQISIINARYNRTDLIVQREDEKLIFQLVHTKSGERDVQYFKGELDIDYYLSDSTLMNKFSIAPAPNVRLKVKIKNYRPYLEIENVYSGLDFKRSMVLWNEAGDFMDPARSKQLDKFLTNPQFIIRTKQVLAQSTINLLESGFGFDDNGNPTALSQGKWDSVFTLSSADKANNLHWHTPTIDDNEMGEGKFFIFPSDTDLKNNFPWEIILWGDESVGFFATVVDWKYLSNHIDEDKYPYFENYVSGNAGFKEHVQFFHLQTRTEVGDFNDPQFDIRWIPIGFTIGMDLATSLITNYQEIISKSVAKRLSKISNRSYFDSLRKPLPILLRRIKEYEEATSISQHASSHAIDQLRLNELLSGAKKAREEIQNGPRIHFTYHKNTVKPAITSNWETDFTNEFYRAHNVRSLLIQFEGSKKFLAHISNNEKFVPFKISGGQKWILEIRVNGSPISDIDHALNDDDIVAIEFKKEKDDTRLMQSGTRERIASWGVNPDSFMGRSILAPILEFHWTPVLTWGMNPVFIAVFPVWGSLMAVLFAGLLFALSHGTPGKNQSWSDFRGRLLASWTIHLLAFAPMLLNPSLISSLSSVPLLNSWLDFSLAHPYISQALSALGLHGLWNAGPWKNLRLMQFLSLKLGWKLFLTKVKNKFASKPSDQKPGAIMDWVREAFFPTIAQKTYRRWAFMLENGILLGTIGLILAMPFGIGIGFAEWDVMTFVILWAATVWGVFTLGHTPPLIEKFINPYLDNRNAAKGIAVVGGRAPPTWANFFSAASLSVFNTLLLFAAPSLSDFTSLPLRTSFAVIILVGWAATHFVTNILLNPQIEFVGRELNYGGSTYGAVSAILRWIVLSIFPRIKFSPYNRIIAPLLEGGIVLGYISYLIYGKNIYLPYAVINGLAIFTIVHFIEWFFPFVDNMLSSNTKLNLPVELFFSVVLSSLSFGFLYLTADSTSVYTFGYLLKFGSVFILSHMAINNIFVRRVKKLNFSSIDGKTSNQPSNEMRVLESINQTLLKDLINKIGKSKRNTAPPTIVFSNFKINLSDTIQKRTYLSPSGTYITPTGHTLSKENLEIARLSDIAYPDLYIDILIFEEGLYLHYSKYPDWTFIGGTNSLTMPENTFAEIPIVQEFTQDVVKNNTWLNIFLYGKGVTWGLVLTMGLLIFTPKGGGEFKNFINKSKSIIAKVEATLFDRFSLMPELHQAPEPNNIENFTTIVDLTYQWLKKHDSPDAPYVGLYLDRIRAGYIEINSSLEVPLAKRGSKSMSTIIVDPYMLKRIFAELKNHPSDDLMILFIGIIVHEAHGYFLISNDPLESAYYKVDDYKLSLQIDSLDEIILNLDETEWIMATLMAPEVHETIRHLAFIEWAHENGYINISRARKQLNNIPKRRGAFLAGYFDMYIRGNNSENIVSRMNYMWHLTYSSWVRKDNLNSNTLGFQIYLLLQGYRYEESGGISGMDPNISEFILRNEGGHFGLPEPERIRYTQMVDQLASELVDKVKIYIDDNVKPFYKTEDNKSDAPGAIVDWVRERFFPNWSQAKYARWAFVLENGILLGTIGVVLAIPFAIGIGFASWDAMTSSLIWASAVWSVFTLGHLPPLIEKYIPSSIENRNSKIESSAVNVRAPPTWTNFFAALSLSIVNVSLIFSAPWISEYTFLPLWASFALIILVGWTITHAIINFILKVRKVDDPYGLSNIRKKGWGIFIDQYKWQFPNKSKIIPETKSLSVFLGKSFMTYLPAGLGLWLSTIIYFSSGINGYSAEVIGNQFFDQFKWEYIDAFNAIKTSFISTYPWALLMGGIISIIYFTGRILLKQANQSPDKNSSALAKWGNILKSEIPYWGGLLSFIVYLGIFANGVFNQPKQDDFSIVAKNTFHLVHQVYLGDQQWDLTEMNKILELTEIFKNSKTDLILQQQLTQIPHGHYRALANLVAMMTEVKDTSNDQLFEDLPFRNPAAFDLSDTLKSLPFISEGIRNILTQPVQEMREGWYVGHLNLAYSKDVETLRLQLTENIKTSVPHLNDLILLFEGVQGIGLDEKFNWVNWGRSLQFMPELDAEKLNKLESILQEIQSDSPLAARAYQAFQNRWKIKTQNDSYDFDQADDITRIINSIISNADYDPALYRIIESIINSAVHQTNLKNSVSHISESTWDSLVKYLISEAYDIHLNDNRDTEAESVLIVIKNSPLVPQQFRDQISEFFIDKDKRTGRPVPPEAKANPEKGLGTMLGMGAAFLGMLGLKSIRPSKIDTYKSEIRDILKTYAANPTNENHKNELLRSLLNLLAPVSENIHVNEIFVEGQIGQEMNREQVINLTGQALRELVENNELSIEQSIELASYAANALAIGLSKHEIESLYVDLIRDLPSDRLDAQIEVAIYPETEDEVISTINSFVSGGELTEGIYPTVFAKDEVQREAIQNRIDQKFGWRIQQQILVVDGSAYQSLADQLSDPELKRKNQLRSIERLVYLDALVSPNRTMPRTYFDLAHFDALTRDQMKKALRVHLIDQLYAMQIPLELLSDWESIKEALISA